MKTALIIYSLTLLFAGFKWGVYDFEKSLDDKADYIHTDNKKTVWVKRK